jgi:hypothetical protein
VIGHIEGKQTPSLASESSMLVLAKEREKRERRERKT